MFVPIPVRLIDHRTGSAIPAANVSFIALNVLFFLLDATLGRHFGIFSASAWALDARASWFNPLQWLAVVTHGFAHAGFWHLLFNMWFLWVFGNPVNRRLGNGNYALAYLGAIAFIGLVAKCFAGGLLLGASGGVFAVMAIAMLLMPASRVELHYLATFPITLLLGLWRPPDNPIFWFIRWGTALAPALACFFIVPLLELCGLLFSYGWNWTNLAHLLGFLCGIVAVLVLPTRISMGREPVLS